MVLVPVQPVVEVEAHNNAVAVVDHPVADHNDAYPAEEALHTTLVLLLVAVDFLDYTAVVLVVERGDGKKADTLLEEDVLRTSQVAAADAADAEDDHMDDHRDDVPDVAAAVVVEAVVAVDAHVETSKATSAVVVDEDYS